MTTTTIDTLGPSVPMSLKDRCDRCGSQAFIRASIKDLTLMFCGHHGAANMDALVIQNFDVEDFREDINKKPSLSSA